MQRHAYAYTLKQEADEVMFVFPGFDEIVSGVPEDEFRRMTAAGRSAHAGDALLTALQLRMRLRQDIPSATEHFAGKRDGLVVLNVTQALKLELYALFRTHFDSYAALARRLGRQETVVRRLFDLQHPSKASEIEDAIQRLGGEIVHLWKVEVGGMLLA
jgi:hypothetical protein